MNATRPLCASVVTPINAINKIMIGNMWNFLLWINKAKISLSVLSLFIQRIKFKPINWFWGTFQYRYPRLTLLENKLTKYNESYTYFSFCFVLIGIILIPNLSVQEVTIPSWIKNNAGGGL